MRKDNYGIMNTDVIPVWKDLGRRRKKKRRKEVKIDFLPLTEPRPILRSRFREAMACRPRKEKGIGCPDCPKIPKFSQKKLLEKVTAFSILARIFLPILRLGAANRHFPDSCEKKTFPLFLFFFCQHRWCFRQLAFSLLFYPNRKRGIGSREGKALSEKSCRNALFRLHHHSFLQTGPG